MAKTALINRDRKRRETVKKFAARRKERAIVAEQRRKIKEEPVATRAAAAAPAVAAPIGPTGKKVFVPKVAGDAAATAMGWAGEFNIGELCRTAFGHDAVAIGFGTDRGAVAAASGVRSAALTSSSGRTRSSALFWCSPSAKLVISSSVPNQLLSCLQDSAFSSTCDGCGAV